MALLELRGGQYREVEFLGMADDTLEVRGTLDDGTSREVRVPKSALASVHFEGAVELDLSRSEGACPDAGEPEARAAVSPDSAAADSVPAEPAPPPPPEPKPEPPRLATLEVTASEEGLRVWIDGRETKERTPASIDSLEPGDYFVEVRWLVEQNTWAAQKRVTLRPGERKRVHLVPERVRPILSIRSVPEPAELWLEPEPDRMRPSKLRTPYRRIDVDLGLYPVTLAAEGYRDTSFVILLEANRPNALLVEMTPLSDAERAAQAAFLKRRARRNAGKTLLWSAVPPLGAAVALFALADHDYELAREKKRRIEGVVVDRGPHFDRLKSRNRALAEGGDKKRLGGWVFTGLGGALLVAGAVLSVDF